MKPDVRFVKRPWRQKMAGEHIETTTTDETLATPPLLARRAPGSTAGPIPTEHTCTVDTGTRAWARTGGVGKFEVRCTPLILGSLWS